MTVLLPRNLVAMSAEENILDEMGIPPFDDNEEEDFAPPTKRPTSIRLSPATTRQLAWLVAAGHGNQSEVIGLAVDRMYRDESRG